MAIKLNKKAPNFKLIDQSGKDHQLKNFIGKNIVIYFYPKDNTPGCTKESCSFRDLNKDFSSLNTIIIGISKDSPESHQKFIEKFSLPFLLLCDEDTKMMQEYEAWGEKQMYGKKYMGIIRSTVIINTEGIVIKHWDKVSKAEDHPQKVLNFLKENLG